MTVSDIITHLGTAEHCMVLCICYVYVMCSGISGYNGMMYSGVYRTSTVTKNLQK